jgi:shikimate dehydrogenase
MQNAAFRAAAVDGVYVALRCSRAAFPAILDGIARAGGAGNVTVPHKQAALHAVEQGTAVVERTGVCNTFWLENGRVCGDNTDVAGFAATVTRTIGDPSGARALLLGAGGGARAVVCALLDAGVSAIAILNRSAERARELRERLDPAALQIRLIGHADELAGQAYDLVVNATTLGLHEGDAEPFDLTRLRHAGAVIDIVYRPGGTAWVRQARSLGIRAIDGVEMLLQQGAAAFELWWQRPAPIDAMRSALNSASS